MSPACAAFTPLAYGDQPTGSRDTVELSRSCTHESDTIRYQCGSKASMTSSARGLYLSPRCFKTWGESFRPRFTTDKIIILILEHRSSRSRGGAILMHKSLLHLNLSIYLDEIWTQPFPPQRSPSSSTTIFGASRRTLNEETLFGLILRKPLCYTHCGGSSSSDLSSTTDRT